MEEARVETRQNGRKKKLVLRTPVKTITTDSSIESTPTESRISFPNDSPDFIVGSQECFRVSWDWREQDHGKPNSSPVTKLQARRRHPKICKIGNSSHNSPPACLRPRRLIVKQDVNIHDVSAFAAELQALAAGQMKVNTESVSKLSNKNLTRSDSQIEDIHVTEALSSNVNSSHSCDNFDFIKHEDNQSNESKKSVLPPSENYRSGNNVPIVKPKEDLNDLFDDSLTEDFIRCSQVVDRIHDAHGSLNQVETPTTIIRKVGCSSKKKRLCLTLKKDSGDVTARRSLSEKLYNNLESNERILPGTNFKSEVTETSKNNHHEVLEDRNNNGSSLVQDPFDDCDDDVLLSIVAMNETELSSKPSSKTTADTNHCPPTEKQDFFSHRNCYEDKDDDWVSPDVLGIIDSNEKKALEEQPSKTSSLIQTKPLSQNKEASAQFSSQDQGTTKTISCSNIAPTLQQSKQPININKQPLTKKTQEIEQTNKDDWMSSYALSLIDCCEKKAFEKQPSERSTASLEQKAVPLKEAHIQLSTQNKNLVKTSSCSVPASGISECQIPVKVKETLSSAQSKSGDSRALCTPEEIEQKRLEAIRKRRDRLKLRK